MDNNVIKELSMILGALSQPIKSLQEMPERITWLKRALEILPEEIIKNQPELKAGLQNNLANALEGV